MNLFQLTIISTLQHNVNHKNFIRNLSKFSNSKVFPFTRKNKKTLNSTNLVCDVNQNSTVQFYLSTKMIDVVSTQKGEANFNFVNLSGLTVMLNSLPFWTFTLKVRKIIKDSSHLSHIIFSMLPSWKRYCSIKGVLLCPLTKS